MTNIRRYIRDNPANADVHRFGEPCFFAGNRAFLDLPMTPFDASVDRFSAARAARCNQYALHLARDIVVGHVSDGGTLACLLADVTKTAEDSAHNPGIVVRGCVQA